jgi:hypothetical protein
LEGAFIGKTPPLPLVELIRTTYPEPRLRPLRKTVDDFICEPAKDTRVTQHRRHDITPVTDDVDELRFGEGADQQGNV